MNLVMDRERLERILKWFPHIHLFGRVYLVRSRRYHAKIYGNRFLFGYWTLHIMAKEGATK